jgi:hypothetical protein
MTIGKNPSKEAHITIGSSENMETISELYLTSLPQDVISTTEDKLRLTLMDNLKKMEKKRSWLTPLGLVISLTLTLMLSGFKDWGLTMDTWKAIFIIGDIASGVWLVYAVIEAFRSVKIDDVIAELKKQSDSMLKFVKK